MKYIVAIVVAAFLLSGCGAEYAENCFAKASSGGGGRGAGSEGVGNGDGSGESAAESGCSKTPVSAN